MPRPIDMDVKLVRREPQDRHLVRQKCDGKGIVVRVPGYVALSVRDVQGDGEIAHKRTTLEGVSRHQKAERIGCHPVQDLAEPEFHPRRHNEYVPKREIGARREILDIRPQSGGPKMTHFAPSSIPKVAQPARGSAVAEMVHKLRSCSVEVTFNDKRADAPELRGRSVKLEKEVTI